jgi:hypothetical protein
LCVPARRAYGVIVTGPTSGKAQEVDPPERIYILDEIEVKPGLGAIYRQAPRTEYLPAAQRRGMRLEQAWQHPPGSDIDGLATTLFYLWSVEGTQGWWAMRLSRRADGSDDRPDKQAWWDRSDTMTSRRTRRMLTDQPQED